MPSQFDERRPLVTGWTPRPDMDGLMDIRGTRPESERGKPDPPKPEMLYIYPVRSGG